jgi:aspartate ammonia-lyase
MNEVTKEDLNRVHNRVDAAVNALAETNVKLERVATTLENIKIPEQPCHDLRLLSNNVEKHIREHSMNRQTWKSALVNGTVRLVIAAIIAATAYMFGTAFSREKNDGSTDRNKTIQLQEHEENGPTDR